MTTRSLTNDPSHSSELNLTSAETVAGIDLVLRRTASIADRVTRPDSDRSIAVMGSIGHLSGS